jgi:hypothetical protein
VSFPLWNVKLSVRALTFCFVAATLMVGHRGTERAVQKDYITERLKFLTEFFKLCWLSIFAVGGGTVSVFLVQGNPYRDALVSAGGLLMALST